MKPHNLAAKSVTIWTIGHSNRTIEAFLAMLQGHQIALVADVRRFPGSRRHPQFSQIALSDALRTHGIDYLHLPELGGRRAPRPDSVNTAWRHPAFRGYADYMQSDEFLLALERLLDVARRQKTVIMCAEALWWQCHRALIADYLKAYGHSVLHILSKSKTEPHPFTSAATIAEGKLSYRPVEEQMNLEIAPQRRTGVRR